jgi:tetratricopeptide (TPR) repeat protein
MMLRDIRIPLTKGDRSQLIDMATDFKDRVNKLGPAVLGTTACDLPTYLGMNPVQAPRFVGRASEIWDLHAKLTANRISVISGTYGQAAMQLRGLGGNGKSLLAREYAIRFGPAYPGGVFWLNAYGHDETRDSPRPNQREALRQEQIVNFANQLGLPTEALKPEQIEAAFWREVEARGKHCLWIVDDLPPGIPIKEFESAWHARWHRASTLVTTRSREYGSLGDSMDLGVLLSREGMRLLCWRRKPSTSVDQLAAERITQLLGCHPLAIDVAGSYLATEIEGFESYAAALEDPDVDAVEFGNLLKESLPTGHEKSVSATLLRSIRQLGPEGMDFLKLAAVLAVAPIQVSFVTEVFAILTSDPKVHSSKAIDQADTLSLCERQLNEYRAVHTLVGRAIRFQFPRDPRTNSLRAAAVHILTRRLRSISHIGEHSNIAMDLPHARYLVASGLNSKEDAMLAHIIALRDYERADYVSARMLGQQVLEADRGLLGEEHPDTLTAMNNLAQTIKAQGHLQEARQIEEHVLNARERLFGDDHVDTLTAKHNLAETLAGQGQLVKARRMQEHVVKQLTNLVGAKHRQTLNARNNLATTLIAQGDLAGARKLQEEVLEIRRNLFGDDHLDTLTSVNNLAGTLFEQGDFAGAEKMLEAVVAANDRLLGKQHPIALHAVENLSRVLHHRGDLEKARAVQEKIVPEFIRILGKDHPDTLRAMTSLGLTRCVQGEVNSATNLFEEVLERRRRVLGNDHPATLEAMQNIAGTKHATGKLAQARELQEQLVQDRRRVQGDEHPDTILARINLGQLLNDLGEFQAALVLEREVLGTSRRVLGQDHPTTLMAANNLAVTLSELGDNSGAQQLQEEVVEVSTRILGNQHLDTLKATNNLASTLYDQHQMSRARFLQEQILAISRRQFGEDHPFTLTVTGNLAATKFSQGNVGGGRKLQKQLVEARIRVLGPEHPDTLGAKESLSKMTQSGTKPRGLSGQLPRTHQGNRGGKR